VSFIKKLSKYNLKY